MPFPTDTGTIPATGTGTIGGPFISAAGNVYVIGDTNAGNTTAEVTKATDPETSFSTIDTWSVALGLAMPCVSAFQVGDIIHIFLTSQNNSYYRAWNMGTDTWVAAEQSFAMSADTPEIRACVIGVRSDGDLIVAFHDRRRRDKGKNYERIDYRVSANGGVSWSAAANLDGVGANNIGAALGENCLVDDNDLTHFFFETSDSDLWHRTLTSGDTLNARQVATALVNVWTDADHVESHVGRATLYDDGGTQRISVPYSQAAALRELYATAEDNPTWNASTEATGTDPRQAAIGLWNEKCFSSVANEDDATLYKVLLNNATDDVNYDDRAVDATEWVNDVDFNNITGTEVWANVYIRAGYWRLAICYREAGNVQYDEVQLNQVELFHRRQLGRQPMGTRRRVIA